MSFVINTNIAALNSHTNSHTNSQYNNVKMDKSLEKLKKRFRIITKFKINYWIRRG